MHNTAISLVIYKFKSVISSFEESTICQINVSVYEDDKGKGSDLNFLESIFQSLL